MPGAAAGNLQAQVSSSRLDVEETSEPILLGLDLARTGAIFIVRLRHRQRTFNISAGEAFRKVGRYIAIC